MTRNIYKLVGKVIHLAFFYETVIDSPSYCQMLLETLAMWSLKCAQTCIHRSLWMNSRSDSFTGSLLKIQDLPPNQTGEWMASPHFFSQVSDVRGEAVTPTWGAVKLYPEEAVLHGLHDTAQRKGNPLQPDGSFKSSVPERITNVSSTPVFHFLTPRAGNASSGWFRLLSPRSLFPPILLEAQHRVQRTLPETAVIYALSLGSQLG